jgi:antitoxin (DNA-binding transcriptional repressor) of toxin-antitoxin stability system
MISITLNDLAADSADFFQHLPVGEPCAVVDAGRTVALVIGTGDLHGAMPRQAGIYAGLITIAPDFNEALPEGDEALDRPIS